jgi:hypothetical protein
MPEVVLTNADIEKRLKTFEGKYSLSSTEFQVNPEARARVSDDDEFEWEAYLEHQAALREMGERLHREYLQRLTTVDNEPRNTAAYLAGVAA